MPTSQPEATPGLVEGGNEFYTEPGAYGLRDVLAGFAGGRVIVGVTSAPFKCPPAPSETALLMHDHLTTTGLRDRSEIALVMPLPAPIPPSPAASEALLTAFAERGIEWHPNRIVRDLDPARNVATFADGTEMPYDLFLGVPKHVAPAGRRRLGDDRRWLDPGRPVDARDLVRRRLRRRRRHQRRHTEGRGVRGGAGRSRRRRDQRTARAVATRSTTYGGRGICYLEFGQGEVAQRRRHVPERAGADRCLR